MKQRASWKDIIGIILLTAGIMMLGASVFLCFSGDIWYDELFTMGLAGQPLRELIDITAADVHPPLYYMIVKLFLGSLGAGKSGAEQVMIAKLLSVLPFFLCMLYAVTKIRKHFGMFSAGLYFFLLITMPQMADYTVEIRMYGYALFFITAGMLHAYELTDFSEDRRKDWIHWGMLTVYALAACYTHYFACVAACMIYVYLFGEALWSRRLGKRIKPFLASGAVCALGYLPWLATAVVSQVKNVKENYWIQPLSIRTLLGCVKFLFCPALGHEMLGNIAAVALCLFYGAGFAVWILRSIRRREDKKAQRKLIFCAGCLSVLMGIIGFGFLASALVRPIFVYRYMLPAAGVFWLAFSIMVSELKPGRGAGTVMVLALAVIGVRNYRSFYGEEMWKRVQMEKTQEVLEQIGGEDILIFNFDQVQAVNSFYLQNDSWLWYQNPEPLICRMYPQNHSLVEGEFEDEAGIRRIKELLGTGRNVWFIGSGEAREEIIQKWEAEGIGADEVFSVMLERYWFNIYSIKKFSDIDGRSKKR
ncbi:MAG: hypothetical protein NC429_07490 [Lachnospiraceae bacterium]|nr:hypothetical protein [Lachnospiraceae bacterium]